MNYRQIKGYKWILNSEQEKVAFHTIYSPTIKFSKQNNQQQKSPCVHKSIKNQSWKKKKLEFVTYFD